MSEVGSEWISLYSKSVERRLRLSDKEALLYVLPVLRDLGIEIGLHLMGWHDEVVVRIDIRPVCQSSGHAQKNERGTTFLKGAASSGHDLVRTEAQGLRRERILSGELGSESITSASHGSRDRLARGRLQWSAWEQTFPKVAGRWKGDSGHQTKRPYFMCFPYSVISASR
jgi:hypothetical protein